MRINRVHVHTHMYVYTYTYTCNNIEVLNVNMLTSIFGMCHECMGLFVFSTALQRFISEVKAPGGGLEIGLERTREGQVISCFAAL